MPTINELKAELDDAQTLKMISSAFTEASAARVQKIKTMFETNRQFYEEISHVYHLVRAGHSGQTVKKAETPKDGIMYVGLTSNQRFYGNLNVTIMEKLLSDYEKDSGKKQLLVIGSTGRDFIRSRAETLKHEVLLFEKENPSTPEVGKFLDSVKRFEPVQLYYPKFVSLVSQTVGTMDITQAAKKGEQIPADEINMLLEPEHSKMLDFFERQVRSLLFLRVVLEADLARTAARLITMNSAEERSTALIKVKKGQIRKIQSSIINAKLLETFAALKGIKH